jgi:enamine deaminase RidA (YjgF/YER057c/UK114 family)
MLVPGNCNKVATNSSAEESSVSKIPCLLIPVNFVLNYHHIASMPKFQSHQTPGPWGQSAIEAGYSQAVSISANTRVVITAGQPGIDLKTGQVVTSTLEDQIESVFDTLDSTLIETGVQGGMREAHKMTCFFIDMRNKSTMLEIFRRRYPGTRPALVSVAVPGLALRGMHLEVQAEAVCP